MAKNDVFKDIAAASGCPHAQKAVPATDKPTEDMCPVEMKGEFYSLLRENLGAFMDVFRSIRGRFPGGLVRLEDPKSESLNLTPTLDSEFEKTAELLRGRDDFMEILHHVYARTVETMRASAVIWKAQLVESGHEPAYRRMSELIEPELRAQYGVNAVQMRVARAVDLTLNLGFSFQRLIERMSLLSNQRQPTRDEMRERFRKSVILARQFSTMHRESLRALRFAGAVQGQKGVHVEEFRDPSLFSMEKDALGLVSERVLKAVRFDELDTSDGRFTCPGSSYIPEIWDWTEELSEDYIWSRFN